MIRRRTLLAGLAAAPSLAQDSLAQEWTSLLAEARNRPVFLNAWGGDERTNAFLAWAAERVRALHGIDLRHVRLRDTSEAVARVVAEHAAGRVTGGSVDLIWINGPNFLALKERGLLRPDQLAGLPSAALIDREGKPATVVDFTVPVDGFAVPWRMAQIVFVHDSARAPTPPRTMAAFVEWARANRGRTTHPTARNFLGATFLKQALVELAPDRDALYRPATGAAFDAAAAPLFAWYDALRPSLWRQGRQFPETGAAQRTLLNDGELDLMLSFNPAEAAVGIAQDLLPRTARAYVLEGGTIGNASFLSVPFNAGNAAAALVTADFLLSPEAQAHAFDPRVLGAPTVLDVARLPPADRARFDAIPDLPGLLRPDQLGRAIPEPHPSWMDRVTAAWERRISG
jgi:putative thiamine transport system substrate-binding protein